MLSAILTSTPWTAMTQRVCFHLSLAMRQQVHQVHFDCIFSLQQLLHNGVNFAWKVFVGVSKNLLICAVSTSAVFLLLEIALLTKNVLTVHNSIIR